MADSLDDVGNVFISYSHDDDRERKELGKYFKAEKDVLPIPIWVDRDQIKPGDKWHQMIVQALEKARVAVLLISAHYLASDYIRDEELPRLLERTEQGRIDLLLVILDPCNLKAVELDSYQTVNLPGRPLHDERVSRGERYRVWLNTVQRTKEKLENRVRILPAIRSQNPVRPAAESVRVFNRVSAPHRAKARPLPEQPRQPRKEGELLFTCPEYDYLVWSVAWSPDGRYLASVGWDGKVRIWETSRGAKLTDWNGHDRDAFSVAWSPDGERLASTGGDQNVRVWEVASGNQLAVCEGHEHPVKSVAWSQDGKLLASTSDDGTARMWEAANGQQRMALGGINSIAWSQDGKWLASASNEGVVWVWDAISGRLSATCQAREVVAKQRTLQAPDGTPEYEEEKKLQFQEVYSVAWALDGRRLASAGDDGVVRVWEAVNGRELRAFKVYEGLVKSVAWSPDGERLAAAGSDGIVRVLNAKNGHLLLPCYVPEETYVPEGTPVPEGEEDEEEDKKRLEPRPQQVNSVAWEPGGKRLAAAYDDGAVRVWYVG